jgi:hypothetical protein
MEPPASLSRLAQLPEPLLTHAWSFLTVTDLGTIMCTDRHWQSLARVYVLSIYHLASAGAQCSDDPLIVPYRNSLWKPLCESKWPGMMLELAPALDIPAGSYRAFFVRNRK